MMTYYQASRRRGVTILEVLVSIFVLLIGVTGVIALFPVGVRLSQQAADDVLSAMTAQNALAAVLAEPGLHDRVRAYYFIEENDPDNNTDGDVLGWATDPSKRGIDGLGGTVVSVDSDTSMQVTFFDYEERTLIAKDAGDTNNNCGLMMMIDGPAANKLYRLDDGSSLSGELVSDIDETKFEFDGIANTNKFRLLGARDESSEWATVPAGFLKVTGTFHLGRGAVEGYGYLAIITRLEGQDDTFRVDILVYKGYNSSLPPEGNLPAVACYTTIVSGDMLN
jgi:hypothetical protein